MNISIYCRWIFLCIALFSTCLVFTIARGGRGGGRSGGGRGSSSGGRIGSSSSGGRIGSSSSGSRISSSSSGSRIGSSSSGSRIGSSSSGSRIGSNSGSGISSGGRIDSGGGSNYGSNGQPSSYNGRPHHHHSRPSHFSSYGSDYKPQHTPSPYVTFKPFTFRPLPSIPPIIQRPFSSGFYHPYESDKTEKSGNREPYSFLNLPCPDFYEDYQNYKSILDLIENNKKPRKTSHNEDSVKPFKFDINRPKEHGDCEPVYSYLNLPCPDDMYKEIQRILDLAEENRYGNTHPVTMFYEEKDSAEPFKSESGNKASTENYRNTEVQSRSYSFNSQFNSPYQLKSESSTTESNFPGVTLAEKNSLPKNAQGNSRSENEKNPTRLSISPTENKSTPVLNNLKIQMQSKSDDPYTCTDRRYPKYYLGGYTWQPFCNSPTPAYMKYIGIPTGTNMNGELLKRRGFIGSLMSAYKSAQTNEKSNKYHGVYPSPYGIKHLKNGDFDKYNSSASLYAIFPFVTSEKARKIHKMNYHFVPKYISPRHFIQHREQHILEYGQDVSSVSSEYFNIFSIDYVGQCQQPLKKEHSEIKCKGTIDEIECGTKCEDGYQFPQNISLQTNRCWHVTGVWRPQKNFPDCKPVCDEGCQNGGVCIRPAECRCLPEFRGSRCQFHFLKCDIHKLVAKEKKVNWTCHHYRNETVCKIRCTESAKFESLAAAEYKCTPDGLWSSDTVPHCLVKE